MNESPNVYPRVQDLFTEVPQLMAYPGMQSPGRYGYPQMQAGFAPQMQAGYAPQMQAGYAQYPGYQGMQPTPQRPPTPLYNPGQGVGGYMMNGVSTPGSGGGSSFAGIPQQLMP